MDTDTLINRSLLFQTIKTSSLLDEEKEMLLREYVDGFEKLENILCYIKKSKNISAIDAACIEIAWNTEFESVFTHIGSKVDPPKVSPK